MTNGNKQASPKSYPQIQPNNTTPISSSINNSSAPPLPPNHPSLSSYNDIPSPMTQMIALPSLSSTDTNTNITHSNTNHSNIPPTPPPIPSNTLPNRKRNANQMMNQVEFINESPQSKRQKTQHKMHANNNRKLQTAVQQLQQFANQNGGKLPSLRFLMKLMKVGFPKAHEIIEQYAKVTGSTKEEVQTKMILRQEKDKSQKKRPKKKKNNNKKCGEDKIETDTLSFTTEASDESDNFLNHFIISLKRLLDIISSDNQWYINERDYLLNVNQLEILLDKLNNNIINELDLENKVRIACAYYIIANLYYERGQKNNNNGNNNNNNTNTTALKYIEQSLQLFKLCNTLSNEIEKYNAPMNNNKNYLIDKQISKEYFGHFWKEIVELLQLCGDVLLDIRDFNGAQNYFENAYVLCERIGDVKCNKYLNCILEKLGITHSYKREYNLVLKYGNKCLSNGYSNNLKHILSTRAWVSCNWMLMDYTNGYKLYKNILSEMIYKIGSNNISNVWVISQICRFAHEFIRKEEFDECHVLIKQIFDMISNVSMNESEIDIIEEIHSTFDTYCKYMCNFILKNKNNMFVINKYRNQIYQIIKVLHFKDIMFIKYINNISMKKWNEFKSKNLIHLGQIMSIEFNFIFNGRSNLPLQSQQNARKDSKKIIGYISSRSDCYGELNIDVSHNIKMSFNSTDITGGGAGKIGPYAKSWTRQQTPKEYLGDTVPLCVSSDTYFSTSYNPSNAIISHIIIKSNIFTFAVTLASSISPTTAVFPSNPTTNFPSIPPTYNPTIMPTTISIQDVFYFIFFCCFSVCF